jgi:hypothetical protein
VTDWLIGLLVFLVLAYLLGDGLRAMLGTWSGRAVLAIVLIAGCGIALYAIIRLVGR